MILLFGQNLSVIELQTVRNLSVHYNSFLMFCERKIPIQINSDAAM